MAKEILKCTVCDKYTLKNTHCGQKTINIKPAKYSPQDKWGRYRREQKKNDMAYTSNSKTEN